MTELPTTFGKYYLTEKLATGGMAEIYLAKLIGPSGFEKQLVIKQIHPTLTGQRQFVDLFVAEAKTLVTLTHGNIVPVYELGVVDETYYIAMDYIDGPTLYRLTETMARKGARMEPAIAAWIVSRILDGLDYAHRKGDGVIHRDVSPRNVMLSRDGDVKLVDFGIAVTLGGPGDQLHRESAPTGSFPYMSPEQVRREALTVQTDLFTAGVLLWEMLTGKRLFHRSDPDATLAAVTGEEIPRPSTVRPDIPERLDEVVMKALERDVSARWSSASAMLGALNKYLYALDETPGPRDIAALVAIYCPPETRRLPTHADASEGEEDSVVQRAGAGPSTAVLPRPPDAGPSTSVIPRTPRGKPKRHESFATNLDLKPILEATGQLTAITEEVEPPAEPAKVEADSKPPEAAATAPKTTPRAATKKTDDASPNTTMKIPKQTGQTGGRGAPGRGLLLAAGLVGIVLAAAAIWVFYRGRDRVLAGGDDAALPDAADLRLLGADGALPITELDAGVAEDAAVAAANIDAGGVLPARDAGAPRRDAGAAPMRADAGAAAKPDAGAATEPRGTATLQIGADPWGEIIVDGRAMGRTPRELVVPVGRHTIEIVFPAETPPRKQTFAVDLGAGETKPIQADFSK
jgi:serine/threonine protein kinase